MFGRIWCTTECKGRGWCIEHGADIDAKNSSGRNALMLSCNIDNDDATVSERLTKLVLDNGSIDGMKIVGEGAEVREEARGRRSEHEKHTNTHTQIIHSWVNIPPR